MPNVAGNEMRGPRGHRSQKDGHILIGQSQILRRAREIGSKCHAVWCGWNIEHQSAGEKPDIGVPLSPAFPHELAQRDKTYLSNMLSLCTSFVDYSGSSGSRHIQCKLKTKPLKVEQINLRGLETLHPVLKTAIQVSLRISVKKEA